MAAITGGPSNLSEIPPEILETILLNLNYEDLILQRHLVPLVNDICNDHRFWVRRAQVMLKVEPCDFVEIALEIYIPPEGTTLAEFCQNRYIQLVSRRHAVPGTERYVKIGECLRRSVSGDPRTLIYFERLLGDPEKAAQIIQKERERLQEVEAFRTNITQNALLILSLEDPSIFNKVTTVMSLRHMSYQRESSILYEKVGETGSIEIFLKALKYNWEPLYATKLGAGALAGAAIRGDAHMFQQLLEVTGLRELFVPSMSTPRSRGIESALGSFLRGLGISAGGYREYTALILKDSNSLIINKAVQKNLGHVEVDENLTERWITELTTIYSCPPVQHLPASVAYSAVSDLDNEGRPY